MPVISVANLDSIGLITDRDGVTLPPSAFTEGRNIAFVDGGVESRLGDSEYVQDQNLVPLALFFVTSTLENALVICTPDKLYAYGSSGSLADISPVSPLANHDGTRWTGGNFNGILVVNNPENVPHSWVPSSGSPAVALANWPGTYRAGVLRPFKNFLVAADIYKAGTRYPNLVKWSHPADPGALPVSWDETDPTKDAGEFPLSDTPGDVIDMLPQRDSMIIYKSDSVYAMTYVGGTFIFVFRRLFDSQGIMAPKCAVALPDGRHVVMGRDDVYIHDGQTARSICSSRIRKRIFGRASTFSKNWYCVHNLASTEVWVCVTSKNVEYPDVAFCWNYITDVWSVRDLHETADIEPGQSTEFASGFAWDDEPESASTTWAEVTGLWSIASYSWSLQTQYSWNNDTEIWDQRLISQTAAQLFGAYPFWGAVRRLEDGLQFGTAPVTSEVERTALPVGMRNNAPDIHSVKFFRGLRVNMSGEVGPVTITVGTQDTPQHAPQWGESHVYVIGSDDENGVIDIRATGRLLALKISATGLRWKLHNFEVDVVFGGAF